VAIHLVKIACEMPDKVGRSLSLWDCQELARQLVDSGIVSSICPETVRRILQHHRLKPWRHRMWLGSKTPRDESFRQRVTEIVDLYTRPLAPHEIVLSFDEKTNLQPRGRICETKPALPDRPVQVEHEYRRCGATHLLAAFDTRTGKVYGQCHRRKGSAEFIQLLEQLDREIAPGVTLIHVVLDNLKAHKSKLVEEWLRNHPRFQFHFTPVHCSWMNQVEQWFGTLQRKRLKIADFESLEDLETKVLQYIEQYNRTAHPYNWTTKSVTRVMAWVDKVERDAAA
jgi:transposase